MVPEKQGGQSAKPNGMKSNMCSENESINSQPQNIFARKEIIFFSSNLSLYWHCVLAVTVTKMAFSGQFTHNLHLIMVILDI